MATPLYHVDAFTSVPFAGNPAAVCLLDRERDPSWMLKVAAEMNLSETAFVVPLTHGRFGIRWCTPAVEVDLCGHATLASAHVLWEAERLPRTSGITFGSRSGDLRARTDGDWIELDFPARPEEHSSAPENLEAALGVHLDYIGRTVDDYLVLVDSERTVRELTPDHRALRPLGVRGVIVTAPSDGGFDFVSRFFAPGAGIDEDPVTGSAHCCLGPFWARRLGKNEMMGHQVSRRGGVVRVRVQGDRVLLGGQAVTVAEGTLLERE